MYRRIQRNASVRKKKTASPLKECRFQNGKFRLLFQRFADEFGDFLSGEEHSAEDRPHAVSAGGVVRAHAAGEQTGIIFAGILHCGGFAAVHPHGFFAENAAGFGIQFCDVSRDYGGELFGSEVPVQTEVEEAAVEETKAPIVEETIAETPQTMDMDSVPAEQPVVETTASDVQTVADGFTSVAADVQQEQSVSAAQEEVPDLHVLPPQQEEAAEEVAEQPQTASYTADMDVSEITRRMTVDEAKAVVVQIGTCRGWTLEQVAQRRPASLKWYLYGCDQADNILKAAASVLLDNLQQKAG